MSSDGTNQGSESIHRVDTAVPEAVAVAIAVAARSRVALCQVLIDLESMAAVLLELVDNFSNCFFQRKDILLCGHLVHLSSMSYPSGSK